MKLSLKRLLYQVGKQGLSHPTAVCWGAGEPSASVPLGLLAGRLHRRLRWVGVNGGVSPKTKGAMLSQDPWRPPLTSDSAGGSEGQ